MTAFLIIVYCLVAIVCLWKAYSIAERHPFVALLWIALGATMLVQMKEL